MALEQQVAEAALAVVRANTEPDVRAAASHFLEEWTQTPTQQVWETYASWLQHQLENNSSNNHNKSDMEHTSMQLLCLQLLQAKIRREIPRGTTPNAVLEKIHHLLGSLLQCNDSVALIPTSICHAALSIRCGALSALVSQATVEEASMPPTVALRILVNLPLEVEACSDLNTTQVADELRPFAETVLEACCRFMQRDADTAALATEVLEQWIEKTRLSLSQLNTPLGSSNVTVLPVLVHLLSQSHYSTEQLPLKASRALTEALLVPSDACSDPRRIACEFLMQAIAAGQFLAAPLQYSTLQGWEDACHALSQVLCTLVTEEVDLCVQQPAEALIHLLLTIQSHHQTKVACAALECWLTVQEVSISERHENWKAPLFQRVVECIINRMAYPAQFVTWQEELEVDESEFEEFRRMLRDVLISSYFLLRVNYVRSMVQVLMQPFSPWFVQEAALFALTVSSREICARIKARCGGTSVGIDRDETTQQIVLLGERLCGVDQSIAVQEMASRHWLILNGVCELMGAYTVVWGSKCSLESIYRLLSFLCIAMNHNSLAAGSAAKALKNVMVGCASTLVKDSSARENIPHVIQQSMETVLIKQDEESMANVAEGCTRLLVQLQDESIVQLSLKLLSSPLVQRGEAALQHVPVSNDTNISEQAAEALAALHKYLHVIQVMIRFCERQESASELLNSIWPFLEAASHRLVSFESLLKKTLAIHEQLLRSMPELVAPRFESTLKYVVHILEVGKDPSALAYMASAVEVYGSKNIFDFEGLLNHVFHVLSSHLASKPLVDHCPLIAAFFSLCSRYLLYCPIAISVNQSFPSIVSLAVGCLTECKGESESTRESLTFLSKVYGLWSLPYSDDVKIALQAHTAKLDEIMAHNGSSVVKSCMDILLGGSQILWGATTDCLFAVVSSATRRNGGAGIAENWLKGVQMKAEHAHVYGQVVALLLSLACEQKNKAKCKLLLSDFSNITKGQTSPDALLSYTLP